jgi:hypothetical protein
MSYTWCGKRPEEMTKRELIQAVEELWLFYCGSVELGMEYLAALEEQKERKGLH